MFNNLFKLEDEKKQKEDAINLIKPIFMKYKSTSKDNAMMKEEVIAELPDNTVAEYDFKYLQDNGIIKKSRGKYYYCEENEYKKTISKKMVLNFCMIAILLVCIIIVSIPQKGNTIKTISNTDVSFKISGSWNALYNYSSKYGWDYYRYINTTAPTGNVTDSTTNTIDYANYPARINVYYADTNIKDQDDLKSTIETYIKDELKPTSYTIDTLKTEKGYDAVKIKLILNNSQEVEYIYYIINNSKMAYITTFSYDLDDDSQIEQDSRTIVDSFYWK